jgi:hypothetical protein
MYDEAFLSPIAVPVPGRDRIGMVCRSYRALSRCREEARVGRGCRPRPGIRTVVVLLICLMILTRCLYIDNKLVLVEGAVILRGAT